LPQQLRKLLYTKFLSVLSATLQTVASAALQEAYDDLAVRFNQLELENAKQQMQLVRHGLPRKAAGSRLH
jgi:hypothetical protein